MTIRMKILSAVAAALLAALLAGLTALMALREYRGHVAAGLEDSQRAFYGERMGRLVATVLMEARGLYAATDKRAAEPFGAAMQATLDEIDRGFREWDPLVEPQQRSDYDALRAAAREFQKLRLETVRIARELSPAAAEAQGTSEPVTRNRAAVHRALAALSAYDLSEYHNALKMADAVYHSALALVVSLGGLALVAGAGLAGFIAIFHVSRPLRHATQALQAISSGRDDIVLPERLGRDEISALWRAVAEFRDTRRAQERMRAEQAQAKIRAEEEQRRALVAMADALEHSVGAVIGSITGTSERLLAESAGMKNVSQTVQQSSASAAAASDQTRINMESMAGAAEQMSSSVSEINRRLAYAANLIGTASARVSASDADVTELARSADLIGSMANTIREIAAQTNMLALNATIEAARAGDAGRGFAVVASEVKALAEQTARATQDIEQQIAAIQQATGRTVQAMGEFAHKIQELEDVARQVAAATEEQDVVSRSIAANVQEAAAGSSATASSMADLTSVAGRSGEAAERVLAVAGELARQSQHLEAEVATVLNRIRA